MKGRGSWPCLLAFVLVFAAGFYGLRAGSSVLAVERRTTELRALAAQHRVPAASVLALAAMAPSPTGPELLALVQRFAGLRTELGEPLAAMALLGDEAEARAALRLAGGDPHQAFERARLLPAALPAVEFAQLRQRFAARQSGRE